MLNNQNLSLKYYLQLYDYVSTNKTHRLKAHLLLPHKNPYYPILKEMDTLAGLVTLSKMHLPTQKEKNLPPGNKRFL